MNKVFGYIRRSVSDLSRGLLFGTGFFLSVGLCYIAIAANPFTWSAGMTTATTGGTVTSAGWNAMVNNINYLSGQVVSQIVVQKFTTSGTYTPTPGMKFAVVEVVGWGGSGGARGAGSAGGGGGGGWYARKIVSAATIGSSQSVTVGAGWAAPTSGWNNPGNAWGTSSFGAIVSAAGGSGGDNVCNGGGGWSGTNGDVNIQGQPGSYGDMSSLRNGNGGSSVMWFGGFGSNNTSHSPVGYGAGGPGASNGNSTPAATSGIVIVTEYL